jgi:hypothetical protein
VVFTPGLVVADLVVVPVLVLVGLVDDFVVPAGLVVLFTGVVVVAGFVLPLLSAGGVTAPGVLPVPEPAAGLTILGTT